MPDNPTLRQLVGLADKPAPLSESALVMIDCQNTYTRGVMALEGVEAALDEAQALLERARSAGIPVFHIMHDAGAGSPYDLKDDIGQIVPRVAPRADEPVIVKSLPNAFEGTDLHERLSAAPQRDLVLAGFMTHMCVNSTARAAFNLGYHPSVIAAATATRALPGSDGETVPAAVQQAASLAALSDMFAVVVPGSSDLSD